MSNASASSARAYPNYLAYSNEFWGGHATTYKYLTDSNTDWGQQLKAVKKYLDNSGGEGLLVCLLRRTFHPFRRVWNPCKPLPAADTGWTDYQIDTPQTITGTLLISAGTLASYEWGSNVLNPYREFQKLKPVAFIQDGVFVSDGTFAMRFASALGHVTRPRDLTAAGQLASALVEAQTAVAIDPDELQAQMDRHIAERPRIDCLLTREVEVFHLSLHCLERFVTPVLIKES